MGYEHKLRVERRLKRIGKRLECIEKFHGMVFELLTILNERTDRIMATQQEMAVKLDTLNAKLDKIGTEITTLQTDVATLKEQIATAPVNAELQAAFDRVEATAGRLDDMNPDA